MRALPLCIFVSQAVAAGVSPIAGNGQSPADGEGDDSRRQEQAGYLIIEKRPRHLKRAIQRH